MMFDRFSLSSQRLYATPFKASSNPPHLFMNVSFVIAYRELLFQYIHVHVQ